LLASAAVFAGDADVEATFADIAQPCPRSAGAPKASDVCFSTRWRRPTSPTDPHDSLPSARAFHATRLDWLYLSGNAAADKAFVAKAKAQGYLVGGTLNSSLTDTPDTRSFQLGRTVNLKGEPLKDPWTKKWGMRFGCPNHPDYATVFLAHARYALEAGVDYFQMDGVQLNEIMMHHGGCFCTHCMKGFQEYLAAHSTPEPRVAWGVAELSGFNYAQFLLDLGNPPDSPVAALKGPRGLRRLFEDFQVESGLRFLASMHAEIDRIAGRKLAYSCNATREFLTTYHKVHDFALIEAYPSTEGIPGFLYSERLKKARELGTSYLFTLVSDDVEHNRRFIAVSYALGANVIVPWDVFTGFETPRFFGTPDQFADLFGFVRANAARLDGYEEAYVAGPGIRDPRYAADTMPLQVYGPVSVLAVVRALPGKPDAPVVVHLVATEAGESGPVRLTLDPQRFFGGRSLKMRFLTPPPYDAAVHEKAAVTGDASSLVRSLELPGGRVAMVELPAVTSWGMLVVEPGNDNPETPWQPGLWCDEQTRFGGTLEIRLACATPGAHIRYTLDDTEPTTRSQPYTQPLRLPLATTVRALAFGPNGAASRPALARFERGDARPRLSPDAPALRDSLKLWLRAESLAAELPDGTAVRSWPAVAGPEAMLPAGKLYSGETPTPPRFSGTGLNGRSCVRFDGATHQMVIPGFANAHLAGKAFTVFLVTQSMDSDFGICGNAANGNGGIPRLYLTRGQYCYDTLDQAVEVGKLAPGLPAITVYRHDGVKTASARAGGIPGGTHLDRPVVPEFGSGGNLAIPFWSGKANHSGDIAEIIVYDRTLPDPEMEAIEEDLAVRYGIGMRPIWR
jgi:hypothetical protein